MIKEITVNEQTFADSIQAEIAKLAIMSLSADELAHLAFMKYREGLKKENVENK